MTTWRDNTIKKNKKIATSCINDFLGVLSRAEDPVGEKQTGKCK